MHNSSTIFLLPCLSSPNGSRSPHYQEFMITFRHTTLDRIPLEIVISPAQPDLTTHNANRRQTAMPPGGIRKEKPQAHVLDNSATGISSITLS